MRANSAAPRRRKLTEVDGLTKQEVHDYLVHIVTLLAEGSNEMRGIFVSKGGIADALRNGEADRIVRSLTASDNAYEWPQYIRWAKEKGVLDQFKDVIKVYRRMAWKRGDRSGPRIKATA